MQIKIVLHFWYFFSKLPGSFSVCVSLTTCFSKRQNGNKNVSNKRSRGEVLVRESERRRIERGEKKREGKNEKVCDEVGESVVLCRCER
jgi:hypothetical protein